jgi:hypothetical protein
VGIDDQVQQGRAELGLVSQAWHNVGTDIDHHVHSQAPAAATITSIAAMTPAPIQYIAGALPRPGTVMRLIFSVTLDQQLLDLRV